jgi:hypothetical protein
MYYFCILHSSRISLCVNNISVFIIGNHDYVKWSCLMICVLGFTRTENLFVPYSVPGCGVNSDICYETSEDESRFKS